LGVGAMTVDEISKVIDDATRIECMAPRFHIAGGEAWIEIPGLFRLFDYARSRGFVDVTSTTN